MSGETPGASPEEMGLRPEDLQTEKSERPEPSKEDVDKLREELKDVFDPKFTTWGHGAWVESAKGALSEGLKAQSPDLQTTAVPLFDTSKDYSGQDETLKMILDWPHERLPAVVLVMIPNKPEELQTGASDYFNSVFQELPPEKAEEYGVKYVVPPKFIRGYVDVENKKFIPNDLFKPEVPEVTSRESGLPRGPKPVGPVSIPGSAAETETDVW